jgi:FkbM family methyltransferase
MFLGISNSWVLALKRIVYGRRGEPSANGVNRYDALQILWLEVHLKEGDIALDIGAHYGVYSLLMSAKCGRSGRVIAFEPDPDARALMARNLGLNSDLSRPVIEPIACSDENGNAFLFTRGGNGQSSLARSGVEFSAHHHAHKISVPLVTLDSYLESHRLPEPRLVKIDAEGAEIRILKGASKLLNGTSDVLCELHPYAWPEFGNTFTELKAIAANAHRHIRYLDQEEEVGEQAQYGTVSILRYIE